MGHLVMSRDILVVTAKRGLLLASSGSRSHPVRHRTAGMTETAAAAAAKSLQSCLTLCDPIDGSPPDSPVPGILQARTLEWVAISFSYV